MDALLVKIFATALTLSQVTTAPEAIKTQFDRVQDQGKVVTLLQAGCAHMRKAFDIEDLNLDDLIATAMEDPQGMTGGIAAFRGINFSDLFTAYKQFCKNETVAQSPFDMGQVIDFYNKAVADLPDPAKLKSPKLPGATVVLDGKGTRFAELFESDQRRVWVALADIPKNVQQAFVSAEDKRFYQHSGIDERSLIRAFVGNIAHSGRPQGGSTITQQVVKNLLVGEDLTYERKIREMILTARVERLLSKAEILELYLNSTYLGRGSWGVEMAARSYFGKSVKALSLGEGALLAALTKGPTYFSPDQHADRAQERIAYVLGRMQEDGAIDAAALKQAANPTAALVPYENPRRDLGFHFVDHLAREAKSLAGIDALTSDSFTVHSTIQPALQRATEAALQEGLARFEIDGGRVSFQSAEANLANAIKRIQSEPKSGPQKPPWQQALEHARLPLYDVHWPVAIVVDKGGGKGGDGVRVGLTDGRILPLAGLTGSIGRNLKLYDVVFVHLSDPKAKNSRAEIRVRPAVQGAALVLDNKTGRILAMSGGFSYPLSQLNRTTQSVRQPGSALKPLTYLAALQQGLQPNTMVRDQEITLPPIGGGIARDRDYWTPKNYDGGEWGVVTLRRALENSRNLATVNLLEGGIASDPHSSLDRICDLALEAQIYRECVPYYPFVLGAQPVRPIDLAPFYAAIANEGVRPTPYAIDSIERNGLVVYRHDAPSSSHAIGSADRVSFFQLKTMLQGVLARGTARSIANLSPYVAGKTGTTEGENDAWFMGITNDVTVAVWVGYDNADGKRRTLGSGQTGASVAIPIFQPIIEAVWAQYAPKTPLNPPSAEAKRELVIRPINLASGDVVGSTGGAKSFIEYFRRDRRGEPFDTQFQLVSRDEAYSARETAEDTGQEFAPPDSGGRFLFPFGGDPWRSPPPPQPVQPQRRDAYGQPQQPYGQQQPFGQTYGQPSYGQPPQRGSDPRSGVQPPRSNPGFFWNWR
ncbi:MAG TPA: transglycosylase domain-containing protein [Xanthobacteraceae bacterium]